MAPRLADAFPEIVEGLTGRYGRPSPPAWDLDPFEALVATLLDRALEPPKRNLAIDTLRDAGLLDPQTLAESDPAESGEALRSAGVKIPDKALVPLGRVARWLVEIHHGDAEALAPVDADDRAAVSTTQLRDELVALNGIGPATADTLLLHALRRPVYPMDRATYRIFVRHGWLDTTADYEEARDAVERLAPEDAPALARLSLWMEAVGRDYCRASTAKCEKCPLRPFLPEGGPIDPNG